MRLKNKDTIKKIVMIGGTIVVMSIIGSSAASIVNAISDNPIDLYIEWDEDNQRMVSRICNDMDMEDAEATVLSIIWHESRFESGLTNLNYNGTTDYGLMQINDACVPFLRDRGLIKNAYDLMDDETNIECGVELLKYHLNLWDSMDTALFSYQVGEGAARYRDPGESLDFIETIEARNDFDKFLSKKQDSQDGVIKVESISIPELGMLKEYTIENDCEAFLSDKEDCEGVNLQTLTGIHLLDPTDGWYIVSEDEEFNDYVRRILLEE